MQRKQTPWKCVGCGNSLQDDPDKYIRKTYTVTRVLPKGKFEEIVMTPEKQRDALLRCMDCDGDNVLTALDVRTEAEFDELEYDDQRNVAQGVDESTPIPVVIAVLRSLAPSLNHEDEDLIPAINVAIEILGKYEGLQQ